MKRKMAVVGVSAVLLALCLPGFLGLAAAGPLDSGAVDVSEVSSDVSSVTDDVTDADVFGRTTEQQQPDDGDEEGVGGLTGDEGPVGGLLGNDEEGDQGGEGGGEGDGNVVEEVLELLGLGDDEEEEEETSGGGDDGRRRGRGGGQRETAERGPTTVGGGDGGGRMPVTGSGSILVAAGAFGLSLMGAGTTFLLRR